MKKIKPFLLALIGFALVSFTFNNSSILQENLEDVGIIKQSLLKQNQFNKTQKGTWILLNGQEINKESELYKLLEENFDLNILTKKGDKYFLPNASGAFIRSSNVNGEGNDPNKKRIVGSLQKDAFQGHKHINGNDIAQYYKKESPNTPKQRHNVTSAKLKNSAGKFDAGYGSPRIAVETRPINISLYTYIKISD